MSCHHCSRAGPVSPACQLDDIRAGEEGELPVKSTNKPYSLSLKLLRFDFGQDGTIDVTREQLFYKL
jgi:hypothetical protein